MPSGRLVAADPAWIRDDDEPFTVAVPPGSYPVKLSVVRFENDPDHRRVAAARLAVRDVPADSWEMAVMPGQDRGHWRTEDSTDSASTPAREASITQLRRLPSCDPPPESGWLGNSDLPRLAFTVPASEPGHGVDLIGYHSGWGDGAYPVWIGRSAEGDVVCFVADMLLLPDNVTQDED